MMDPAKPGGRTRMQAVAPQNRLRTPSDEGLVNKWTPQQNISPLIVLNSRPVSPPPPAAKRSPDPLAVEHLKLYPSYVAETDSRELPYEAHVQGWLYAPGINRKGRLMVLAVERLMGNPGKYASIADAAAQTHAEDQLGEVGEHDEPSSGWMGLRPSIFRTRSSKGSAPNSQPTSANTSQNNSRAPSRAASPEPCERPRPSSPTTPDGNASVPLHSPSSIGSPESSPFSSSENVATMSLEVPPKRPGMRRTATYTFDARSNPKGKAASVSAQARREQKQVVRDRLAAISHKSLSMRGIQISVLSEPDSRGHRKKRTFWTETDDGGRFSYMCPVPFRPDRVRTNHGPAVAFSDCFYVPRSGVSVISDIDDTVRHTGVTKSKRELLQNVLAKSYDECQVDGVRDWYQKMADAGATFHYVSNSPWQLFDVTHGYLRHHGFPEGSMHLKKYAGVFDGLTEPAKGRKKATLEKILQDFPDRRFILVGDSGEADLEAYSELTRKFPHQVLAIYIRDITIPHDEPLYDPRTNTAHRRHHSADLIAMDNPPDYPARPKRPPELPPRRRQPPDLPSRANLAQSTSDSASDTISAIVGEAEQSDISFDTEASPTSTVVPDKTSGDELANRLPQIKTTPSSTSVNGAPKLPPRPKLLRRTSSKIMDSVNAVASASSHAVGSAAKFLGPHGQSGSSLGAPPNNATTSKTKNMEPRVASLHLVDDINDQPPVSHRKRQSGSSSSSATSFGSLSRSPTVNMTSSSPQPSAGDGVFVTSSQDFIDIDRVDKRVEQWRMRLAKQHRLLPRHVHLKAWRQPSDVEAQSLQLIKGDESLI